MLFLAACAELPPLAENLCGNAIVEAANGEDCDTFAVGDLRCGAPGDLARSCRFVCDDTDCPAGMACGADRMCRRPSGAFAEVVGSP